MSGEEKVPDVVSGGEIGFASKGKLIKNKVLQGYEKCWFESLFFFFFLVEKLKNWKKVCALQTRSISKILERLGKHWKIDNATGKYCRKEKLMMDATTFLCERLINGEKKRDHLHDSLKILTKHCYWWIEIFLKNIEKFAIYGKIIHSDVVLCKI